MRINLYQAAEQSRVPTVILGQGEITNRLARAIDGVAEFKGRKRVSQFPMFFVPEIWSGEDLQVIWCDVVWVYRLAVDWIAVVKDPAHAKLVTELQQGIWKGVF